MDKNLHRPSTKLKGHSTSIIAADWSAGSSRLVSAALNEPTVRVWDVEAARTVSRLTIAEGVSCARLSPAGDRLVAMYDDKVVRMYDLASGRELASAGLTARPQAMAVSPGGVVYWAGWSADGTVLWSWIPGEAPKPLLKDIHSFEARICLSLSQDGAELWCFFEWDIVGFDTRTNAEIARFKGERDWAFGEGFVLSPERCAVGVQAMLNRDDDPVRPRLYRWDLESGGYSWRSEILRHAYDSSPLLTMAQSKRWLASVGRDAVMVYSLRSGRALGMLPFKVRGGSISCLSLSPDERSLAVGASNGNLVVYDFGEGLLEPIVAAPHIARRSRQGSQLLLRLEKRPGLWLRVHANGDLERAEGDARAESAIAPLAAADGDQKPRAVYSPRFHGELCRRLWQHDLTKPSPWSKSHSVQVFMGDDLVVEGYVGAGSDKGMSHAFPGLDSDPDSVGERLSEDLSARTILASIDDLLASLPDNG